MTLVVTYDGRFCKASIRVYLLRRELGCDRIIQPDRAFAGGCLFETASLRHRRLIYWTRINKCQVGYVRAGEISRRNLCRTEVRGGLETERVSKLNRYGGIGAWREGDT